MERFNQNTNHEKSLSSLWSRRQIQEMRPLTISTIPINPSSHQEWNETYLTSHVNNENRAFFHSFNPQSVSLFSSINHNKLSPDCSVMSSRFGVTTPRTDNFVETERGSNAPTRPGREIDPNMDPKRLKRILSNRISAQKSRQKKLQYVYEMERKRRQLEEQLIILPPQVAVLRNQQQSLKLEHEKLIQDLSFLTKLKQTKDAELEKNKAEVLKLRQLYASLLNQNLQDQSPLSGYWEQVLNDDEVSNLNSTHLSVKQYMKANQANVGEKLKKDYELL